jgi:hypothetical protein
MMEKRQVSLEFFLGNVYNKKKMPKTAVRLNMERGYFDEKMDSSSFTGMFLLGAGRRLFQR